MNTNTAWTTEGDESSRANRAVSLAAIDVWSTRRFLAAMRRSRAGGELGPRAQSSTVAGGNTDAPSHAVSADSL